MVCDARRKEHKKTCPQDEMLMIMIIIIMLVVVRMMVCRTRV